MTEPVIVDVEFFIYSEDGVEESEEFQVGFEDCVEAPVQAMNGILQEQVGFQINIMMGLRIVSMVGITLPIIFFGGVHYRFLFASFFGACHSHLSEFMRASKIGDVGLNPYSEDRVEAPDEVVINIQHHVQAHVQAENRKPSRRHLLQWGFTTMAINGTLIYDFSTNPLAGFHIFSVYCSLFLGLLLLLLAATLPRMPISAIVVKNMVLTTVVLLYIELGLKAAILILYKK